MLSLFKIVTLLYFKDQAFIFLFKLLKPTALRNIVLHSTWKHPKWFGGAVLFLSIEQSFIQLLLKCITSKQLVVHRIVKWNGYYH